MKKITSNRKRNKAYLMTGKMQSAFLKLRAQGNHREGIKAFRKYMRRIKHVSV